MKKPKYWYRKDYLIYFYRGKDVLMYSLDHYRRGRLVITGWDKDTDNHSKVEDEMIPYELSILIDQHNKYNIPKKYLKDILKDIANRIML